ncbi:muscle M-line assembly protein unc-89 [Patella vulgata]|uniref:muscle M-line assembly protein unc-89 n=1 Tax=Patella vulgata TaxID=6465 RepID=UPI0024A9A352|nr:muscle M-line assembly protein unc-89 [Patella vulgata]
MTESTEVVLGGSKRFECRVLGFPRPEIRWYKDGVEITHVKRYNFDFTHDGVISMLMEEISHKDQGMYRCRADNSEGTASTSAYLFVRQRRGLPDEDTMSIHSMTMSEVDTEYEERKLELESYAKRMQVDFGGEDFLDEFGSKRTFEDLVSEENRENQLSAKLGLDEVKKGQKDKTDKSISNGYYEESFSSKQESSYYEESYEESSTKKVKMSKKEEYVSSKSSKTSVESQEEFKMTAESSQVAIESSRSEQNSKISTETSIEACQSESSSSQKISIDSEITSSQSGTSSRSASQSESQLLIEASESSFDNSSSSSRTTVEESGLRLVSSEIEVDGHVTSREGTLEHETTVETDSAEVDSSLIMESSVEIESKKKRKKRMSVEMEIEEKSTQGFDVESKTTNTKKVEEIKTLTAEMKTMTKDNFPTDMGSVSSIFSLVSEEGAEESLTPLNPSDVLETKIRNKLQAKVLESESKQESGSLEELVFSEESLTEIRKEEASSRAELRAQLESQAQEASLPQDRLLDIPMDEKEILATSLGHDSGIFDMSMVDTPSRVGESSIEALSESPSLLDSTLTEAQFVSALESKEGDGQSSQATSEKILSQTEEQNLDQADSSQLTDVSRIESQQVQELNDSDKKRALDKAKSSRETALADEQSVVSDDASVVSNLDSMSAEELSISSQIDMKEALDKARSTQEIALVDEVQDGKEDASIVSDLTDLDSIVADELSVDSQADSKKSRSQSRKEAAFVDEISNRDDASIVSDLTDLESIRADEMSIDGQSEITEAELKGQETLHTDQVSVAGSEIDDLSELASVESNLKAKEQETRDSLLAKDSVKIGETVDLLDGPAEEASGVELSDIKDQDLLQEPINEETVSEFSEGSIREASELGLEDAIPSSGQMVTSPSDLTSLVRDAQVASQADPQVSEAVQDTIDGALKDLQLVSTKVSEEPNPNKADVGDIPEILEAEAEKVSKKKRTEDQELYFSSEVETTEKKTKKKSTEEELTLTTSVETSEFEISTEESSTTIQAEVDVSDIKYDEQGLKISASVEVEERRFPPEVVKVPEDVNVQAGETIHLMSEVTGNPKPDVKWFKEGEKVCESQRITLVTEDSVYSLEIREAENSDGGTYTLTAHNAEGTILNDVHVNVSVPPGQEDKLIMENENISVTATLSLPKFTKKPEDTTVSEFDQVQFVCEVQGNPEPKVNWLKEGQKLKSDQRMRIYQSDGQHFLEIPQSSILDSGEYECQASNSEGSTSCHVILTVEAATEQESGLSAAEEVPQASESDVRTRYLKLFGAAAAFTLVAFGFHKLTEGKLPLSR